MTKNNAPASHKNKLSANNKRERGAIPNPLIVDFVFMILLAITIVFVTI